MKITRLKVYYYFWAITLLFLSYSSFVLNLPDKCMAGTLEVMRVDNYHRKLTRNPTHNTFSPFSIEELKMFGVVQVPDGAFVQDTYKGIKFLASPKSRYTKKQLKLLKAFIDRTPSVLLNPGPSAIVTFKRGEIHLPIATSPISLAMASGPYVFFDTSSFNTKGTFSAGSIDGVFRAFIHELVHVQQFHRAVAAIDRKKALEAFRNQGRQTIWNDIALKTKLVRSFMEVTGWTISKRSPYRWIIRLNDTKAEKTSSYGKRSILEDIAETISFVTIGDLTPLSKSRVKWAVKFLKKASIYEILRDTFPYSSLYKEVKLYGASVIKFDKSKIFWFKKHYSIIDIEHFISKEKGSFYRINQYLQKEFVKRGWSKNFTQSKKLPHGVIKRIMSYRGKWRDIYLEVITYDYSKNYTIKPSGTIITVLSGYKVN